MFKKYLTYFFIIISLACLFFLTIDKPDPDYKICFPNCNNSYRIDTVDNFYYVYEGSPCIIYYIDGEGIVVCNDYEIKLSK